MKSKWYHFIYAFLAGLFLINFLPHFINGISGNYFPTPFADPPGTGLSGPVLNVVWGIVNFVVSMVFFYLGKVGIHKRWIWIAVFLGGCTTALALATYFSQQFNA